MIAMDVDAAAHCLVGGGDMGARMRALDWSATAVGPPQQWSPTLRTAVSICLNSNFPMFVWWGDDLTMFYNDAYIPVLGSTKHPMWLGCSARECWREIWDVVGPMADGVFATGEPTWSEDLMLIMDRNLPREEVYFTFSYSPIIDECGVSGVFCACTETTERVMGERRLQTLRDLGARAADASDVEAVCAGAMEILAQNLSDVPFAMVYLLSEEGRRARRVASSGFSAATPAGPEQVELDEPAAQVCPWPLRSVAVSGDTATVRLDATRFGTLPGGVWPESPESALVLPLSAAGEEHLAGLLVVGLSPRRVRNAEYLGFFDLVASHIATGIANASAYTAARRRAEALAELDRVKTEFFSNISHEFRTPLTLMLGPAEDMLADRGEPLPPAQRERLELVHRNGLRLLRLVNALLDFSRIEAGRVNARFAPVDLRRLTLDLASNFRSAIDKAGLQLVLDFPALPEPVYVDTAHWEKIILNLLSNAVKFTFAGEIAVRLIAAPGCVKLSVADTGVGIPASELDKVFDRFHQVRGVQSRTHEGSGIGLALVKELVSLHGGDVELQSTVGEGTCFTVTLPLGAEHLPKDQCQAPPPRRDERSQLEPALAEVLRWLPDVADEFPADAVDADLGGIQASPAPADAPRVLLADDNRDMCEYVARLLRTHYQVESVGDGEAALAAARRQPPDLVLTDVMMPKLDGFGLLRALRADPALREIPVLLLSARAGEESRVDGLEAGADDYMVKPFSARELLARVGVNLQLKQLRESAREALRQSEAAARRQLAEIQTTYDTAPIGLCVIDRELRYVRINDRMAEINGLPAPAHIGRTLREIVPHLADELEEVIAGVIARALPVVGRKISGVSRTGDSERIWLQSYHPLRNERGEVIGVNVVAEEITEHERVSAKVREQARRLREADRRKDEFLAMLAHELRNPLAPIRSAVQLLGLAQFDDAKLVRTQQILDRQTAHLTRLVDDLMDVSRITRGKIELKPTVICVQEVVASAVELSLPALNARRHELVTRVPEAPINLRGDRMRLAQVVSNLLNNAAKFTEPGGRIEIEAATDGAEAIIRVRDSGCGISPEALPTVFDLFAQAHETRVRSDGGLGLGLALVRTLVELHGGSVEVRSEGDNRGAEFIVRLPSG